MLLLYPLCQQQRKRPQQQRQRGYSNNSPGDNNGIENGRKPANVKSV
jgi:hypothetical protein